MDDMMTGALIEGGKCTNVAVFTAGDTATMSAMGYIPCPDGYGIGDLYDGEDWTKAPPESEETANG